jgi:hypothetical protein
MLRKTFISVLAIAVLFAFQGNALPEDANNKQNASHSSTDEKTASEQHVQQQQQKQTSKDEQNTARPAKTKKPPKEEDIDLLPRRIITDKKTVMARLDNMTVSIDFRSDTLEDVITFLRDYSDLNFVIDPSVYKDRDPNQLRITIRLRNIKLRNALSLMLSMHNLAAVYDKGVIMILPKEQLERKVVLRIYDVRDLMMRIRDFPGPNIELRAPDEEEEAGPRVEIFDDETEGDGGLSDPEFLMELIRTTTGGNSWDENPNCSMSICQGLLIVRQSEKVHREIALLIAKLRQYK